jgi:predicted TIM-barrel enzyme
MDRETILKDFHSRLASGHFIVGSGAGIGLSAKCAESAEASFIVVYNSGRYRMAGVSSLAGLMPYGDANATVLEMGAEVIPLVSRTPVVAGVCGTDPFRQMPRFLREIQAMGFSGVQNYPTVCLFDGMMRQNLEETGLGFDKEVTMMATAQASGLLTVAYVANEAEAEAMAAVDVDVVVAHLGLTTSGTIGAKTAISFSDGVERVRRMQDAAKGVKGNILVLCHGGPVVTPDDVRHMLSSVPGVAGFLGASSMERLPTESAITDTIRMFTNLGSK